MYVGLDLIDRLENMKTKQKRNNERLIMSFLPPPLIEQDLRLESIMNCCDLIFGFNYDCPRRRERDKLSGRWPEKKK
jgi:hypothetical protein